MSMKNFSVGVLMLAAIAMTAWAAGFSGKWVGKADNVDITLTLTVSGNTVSGTINNPIQTGEIAIQEGKINGDEITFCVHRVLNENEVKVVWKGKASGDVINFRREIEGRAGSAVDIVAKRIK